MKSELKNTLTAMFGMVLFALGMNLFVVPAGLYSSGVVGFSQVIRSVLAEYMHLSFQNIDISGIIVYMINIPLLILAWRGIGKRFFFKTLICVTSMTVFLTFVPTNLQILSGHQPFVNAIIGAAIAGCGTGLTLRSGGCSGGTDIIGVFMMKRDASFSVGKISIFVNIFVYGLCAILFDFEVVVYSLAYMLTYSMVVDRVHYQNVNVAVMIITHNLDLLKETIQRFNRTATIMEGKGAYTGTDTHVVYTIMSKYEARLLEHQLKEIDPHAFMTVSDVNRVSGNFAKHL